MGKNTHRNDGDDSTIAWVRSSKTWDYCCCVAIPSALGWLCVRSSDRHSLRHSKSLTQTHVRSNRFIAFIINWYIQTIHERKQAEVKNIDFQRNVFVRCYGLCDRRANDEKVNNIIIHLRRKPGRIKCAEMICFRDFVASQIFRFYTYAWRITDPPSLLPEFNIL